MALPTYWKITTRPEGKETIAYVTAKTVLEAAQQAPEAVKIEREDRIGRPNSFRDMADIAAWVAQPADDEDDELEKACRMLGVGERG